MSSSSSSSSSSLLVFLYLFCVASSYATKTSTLPFLKVIKDPKTLQYITQISQRTPLVPVKLTLDLSGAYVWIKCFQGYNSSTYRPVRCGSAPCRLLNTTECINQLPCEPLVPGCYWNNTCTHMAYTPIAVMADVAGLSSDVFVMQSTNAKKVVTVSKLYFLCGTTRISEGLASGVTGMVGLGRSGASLPNQLSSYLRFDRKFTLCLSSSTSIGGVLFGNVDVSSYDMIYTPLIVNPIAGNGFSPGDASPMYYIEVESIKVNGERVKGFDTNLLSINAEGSGGTSISTVDPYMVMETSVYNAVVAAFVKAMPKKVERVAHVAPFRACFRSKKIGRTRVGPDVPYIDFELKSKNVWRIYGANSMVEVKKNVLCLGFVEAGKDFRPINSAVLIGGHQIEDNLLQFDLDKSRVGFSSSLLGRSRSCAKFNFASSV